MRILQLPQLQPGMTLAEDVRSKTGRLLIAKGILLNDQHLRVLKTWGIEQASIVVTGNDNSETETRNDPSEMQILAAMSELEPFFCLVDRNHPFVAALLRLAALKRCASNRRSLRHD